jgi:putative membrane protein
MKILLIPLSFILLLLSCVYPGGGHMMDWGHMNCGSGGVFMWIILLVLVGVIIYFVVQGQKSTAGGGGETPLEILKKRYAKGEISKQEFEKMKKDLE